MNKNELQNKVLRNKNLKDIDIDKLKLMYEHNKGHIDDLNKQISHLKKIYSITNDELQNQYTINSNLENLVNDLLIDKDKIIEKPMPCFD